MGEEEYYRLMDEFLEVYYGDGWAYIRMYIDKTSEMYSSGCYNMYTHPLNIVPAEEFRTMIAEDALLEHAEYAGNYYGTPKRYVDQAMDEGRDVVLEIELQGARQVCAKRPETIRIFIGPPSWEELERRLVSRGTDSPEKIAQRLRQARVELENAGEYDYLVINETGEEAAAEVDAIMRAEHCRTDERLERILKK